MKKILATFLISFSCFVNASITIVDNNTDVVNLRDNCTGVINCATTFEELLNWVWNTRKPSITNPLLVDIGPGIFYVQTNNGSYLDFCKGGSNVTFKGSGVDRTTITGTSGNVRNLIPYVLTDAVIKIKDCDNLTFQDLSIKTRAIDVATGGIMGVAWIGGGKSVWNNVRIKSDYWSWVDICSASGIPGEHKWFGSSLESSGGGAVNSVYRSDCAFSLIHGSEFLTARRASDNSLLDVFVAVEANTQKAQIQLYGTSIRVLYPSNASGVPYKTTSITGLRANDGGIIHMHGGIISVRSEHPTKVFDVIGAEVNNGGLIHTLETAYGMKAGGTGDIKRIVINNGGEINSPFQWPSDSIPPVIQSINGYDTFIETDCDQFGNCSGNSNLPQHPHMMIYDDNCNINGSWFDMVINKCRQ